MTEFDVVKWIKVFKKHRVPMDTVARVVFNDPEVIIKPDDNHSELEERLLAYGRCLDGYVCVCFTYRNGQHRIITTFRVSKEEWEKYHAESV